MDDRHLPASQLRRRRLAAQGDVAKSQELNSTLAFLTLVATAAASFSGAIKWFRHFSESVWARQPNEWTQVDHLQSTMFQVILQIIIVFGSAVLFCVLISIGMNYLQSRKVFLGRSSYSPWGSIYQSFGRIFSTESVFMFFVNLLKIGCLGAVVFFAVKPELELLFQYSKNVPIEWLTDSVNLIFKACFAAAVCLLAFGLIDYGWRRWKYEQRIMMTSAEQRDELREIQTDPQIAAQRRQIRKAVIDRNASTQSVND